MTRAQIRTQIRSLLGDKNSVKFTDAELNTWIDLATDQIITRLEFDTAMATISTVQDEPNYGLPSNTLNGLNELYVTDINGKEYKFDVVDQDQMSSLYGRMWRSDASGKPVIAYRADYNVLGLYPAPDSANSSKTIRIFYDRQAAAASSDSDSPIYLPMLHMANAHWAAMQGFFHLREQGLIDKHQAQFESYFRQAWHKANTFAKDRWQWRFG